LPGAGEGSEERMKFVYVVTTGTDDPTKASLPLHLAANGSVEVGHDTSVLLAGDATEMLLGDNLDQMQGIGVPPVRELLSKLRDHSVPVFV
jgi:predicted peroxiredoxin